jgi:hypothetical protein
VVRRISSAKSIFTPWRCANTSQERACEGIESIMVPSMSKIRAEVGAVRVFRGLASVVTQRFYWVGLAQLLPAQR